MAMSDNLIDRMAVMARRQDQDFEALRAAIARFPDGASLEQINEAAALPISTRTLIRRLADMVERGDLRKNGNSRAARYFPVGQVAAEVSSPKAAQKDMFVPVGKL